MSELNPIIVSQDSWRRFSNTIHWAHMRKMGINIGSVEEIAFLGLEYGGEAGELMNNIKKLWRDGPSSALLTKIRDEVADNSIMLYHIANYFGVNQDQAAAQKAEELFGRWPWIEKLPDHKMTTRQVLTNLETYPADTRRG